MQICFLAMGWKKMQTNIYFSSWKSLRSCLCFYMHGTNMVKMHGIVLCSMWLPHDVKRSLLRTHRKKFWIRKEIDDSCLEVAELTFPGQLTLLRGLEPPWPLLKIWMVQVCVSCFNILLSENTSQNNRYLELVYERTIKQWWIMYCYISKVCSLPIWSHILQIKGNSWLDVNVFAPKCIYVAESFQWHLYPTLLFNPFSPKILLVIVRTIFHKNPKMLVLRIK